MYIKLDYNIDQYQMSMQVERFFGVTIILYSLKNLIPLFNTMQEKTVHKDNNKKRRNMLSKANHPFTWAIEYILKQRNS